jgi:hypothetical protein
MSDPIEKRRRSERPVDDPLDATAFNPWTYLLLPMLVGMCVIFGILYWVGSREPTVRTAANTGSSTEQRATQPPAQNE